MIQTKEELEKFYEKEDPWEFQRHPDDAIRKKNIISKCAEHGPFKQALDIGCGEGWITKDLPAKKIFGYEASDKAKSRWPKKKIKDISSLKEFNTCDLVIATGVLYPQYDCTLFVDMIDGYSNNIIVTSHIKDWEVDFVKHFSWAEQLEVTEFPYREFTQVLRVFKRI